MNKAVLAAFVLGGTAGIVAGCQVYDFEPVLPLTLQQYSEETEVTARGLKPNLMLLVDKSGSMDIAANPEGNASCYNAPDGGVCGNSGAPACPGTCPTRWTELQGAMQEFLTNSGDVARMGLTLYPNHPVCGVAGTPPTTIATPLNQSPDEDPNGRIATANEINARLQEIDSTGTLGGTPTGVSIRHLSDLPELQAEDGRENFILLLTDGLPNCSFDAGVDPNDEAACRCTNPNGCSCTTNCAITRLNCLDETGTVAAIQDARARNIKTIVVGFGAETASGDAPLVLNAMAEAGDFPRRCDDNLQGCAPGDTCSGPGGVCNNTKYYQAASRQELAEQLSAIGGILDTEPCLFNVSLDPPDFDERLVVVYVTQQGQPTQRLTAGPDTFAYRPGQVELLGSTCQLAMSSTPQNKVTVQIRILAPL